MNINNNPTRGGKSPGWAAFDLKHRHHKDQDGQLAQDPYPPLTGSRGHNHVFFSKPFSSVLLSSPSSAAFPALKITHDVDELTPPRCNGSVTVLGESSSANILLALKRLKELHGWADFSLIEDVLASVDNDVEKASTLLKGMISSAGAGDFQENGEAKFESLAADIADLSSTLEDALKGDENKKENDSKELRDEADASSSMAANMKLILGHLKSVPVEPEWEEDDVYLTHRKNALKMMRSASQHSKAATNAFLRRDHVSAQQHSLKAREEWSAAEQLNAKAAKEILILRNRGNDPWKLDLHGLHAAEAVQALQGHLRKIETQVPVNRSTSPRRLKNENEIVNSSTLDTFSTLDAEDLDKQQAAFRQRPTSLQVITGVGNHSRGQAALPTAVSGFLNDNGYRFDETRPGMIMVRPKFHHR